MLQRRKANNPPPRTMPSKRATSRRTGWSAGAEFSADSATAVRSSAFACAREPRPESRSPTVRLRAKRYSGIGPKSLARAQSPVRPVRRRARRTACGRRPGGDRTGAGRRRVSGEAATAAARRRPRGRRRRRTGSRGTSGASRRGRPGPRAARLRPPRCGVRARGRGRSVSWRRVYQKRRNGATAPRGRCRAFRVFRGWIRRSGKRLSHGVAGSVESGTGRKPAEASRPRPAGERRKAASLRTFSLGGSAATSSSVRPGG